MRTLVVVGLIAVFLVSCAAVLAREERVPFVGCPADGQAGPIDPPQGTPKSVTVDKAAADQIAYYEGEQAPGVFAPRGWRCQVTYGSGGAILSVSAESLNATFPRPKSQGPAVELSTAQGGTSGRFTVAEHAAWLFPKAGAEFIERVNQLVDTPVRSNRERYAQDSVRSVDDLTAEFTTPARATGLGTEHYLAPSQDPISGVVVLRKSDPEFPDLLIVRVRLPAGSEGLKSVLLRLNRECLQKGGC
jgi:hypothetical protein